LGGPTEVKNDTLKDCAEKLAAKGIEHKVKDLKEGKINTPQIGDRSTSIFADCTKQLAAKGIGRPK